MGSWERGGGSIPAKNICYNCFRSERSEHPPFAFSSRFAFSPRLPLAPVCLQPQSCQPFLKIPVCLQVPFCFQPPFAFRSRFVFSPRLPLGQVFEASEASEGGGAGGREPPRYHHPLHHFTINFNLHKGVITLIIH